jgi:hypothetical protein
MVQRLRRGIVIATFKYEREAPMVVNDSSESGARPRTPVHLWIIGVLALLWNMMGAFDYLATKLQLDFYMSQFSEEQLAYFYGFPAWVVSAWAFGVWGALAGSVGLLLRRKWSVWAFVVSIAGMVVTTIYNFGMTNGAEIMGSGAMVFSIIIWVISIFLVVYSWSLAKKGVLV